MSTRTDVLTHAKDVDLKWTTWVDYDAPPRYQDTILTYDDFVFSVVYARQVDDFVFMDEQALFSTGFNRVFADPTTLTDVFAPATGYNRVFDDPTVLTDNVTLLLGTTGSVNYADAMVVTDQFVYALSVNYTLADAMVTSDAIVMASSVAANFADTMATSDGVQLDPYWPFVQLLLHGDGPVSGVQTTYLDSSTYGRSMAYIGGPFQGSVSPFASAGGSVLVGLSSAYDLVTATGGAAYSFPAGTDFTVECWFMLLADATPDGAGNRQAALVSTIGAAGDGWALELLGNASSTGVGLLVEKISGGVSDATAGSVAITKNQWHHAAVCRSGTTTRTFLDGVLINSYTWADQNLPSAGVLAFGSNTFGSGNSYNRQLIGYISEVRVSKGVGYYTANFTPPTAPYAAPGSDVSILAHFDNAAVIDSARKNSVQTTSASPSAVSVKWGPTSIAFTGPNPNCAIPQSNRFAPIGNDFTAECWFNLTGDAPVDGSGNRNACLMSAWPTSGALHGWAFYIVGDGSVTGNGFQASFSGDGVTTEFLTANVPVTKNVWHHVALSRTNGVLYIHYDGVVQGSLTLVQPIIDAPNGLILGLTAYSGYPWPLTGYMDDVRFTNGVGRYGNANFALPAAPFPGGSAVFTNTYAQRFADSVAMSEAATIVSPNVSLNYLLVAGGGAGGTCAAGDLMGGGAGAGGVLQGTAAIPIGTYPVTIGAGGTANGPGGSGGQQGNSGGDTTWNGLTAKGGGGGGGGGAYAPVAGGSGGGGGGSSGSAFGAGTAGQGNRGGTSGFSGPIGSGGGGGGFSAAGVNATASVGGAGGAGLNSTISGASVNYAAGGGGGSNVTAGAAGGASGGAGGADGGGGAGARGGGGGGAGGADANFMGGVGGAGIAVFAYPTGSMTATGGTKTTVGGNTIHTFTANGSFQRTA